ncbi:MAG TPA: type II toxin-antitoxin system VapC family toxin [Stellaceae bacterium]|nr:type II toxin-antitoxin system VapC family toxin [Stellaceae bacterium]
MPKTSELRPLLLDTHIWLWLVLGNEGLSPASRSTVSGATSIGNLRIAAITVWEVGMLVARHRVSLGKPTLQWVKEAVAASTVVVEPLSPDIAIESNELPDAFHADPADRMIVATARVTNAKLMTHDRQILDYAARGHLTAVPA